MRSASPPPTSRTATTGCGSPSRPAPRAPPAGTAPATSVTWTTQGRLWVEGRLVHVITDRRRPGHAGRHRAAGRVGPRASGLAAAVVGVGPAGTQQTVVVVSRRAAPERSRCADPDLATARPGRRRHGGRRRAGHRPAAGRHPARLEDRPGPSGRWADAVLAGRRGGRSAARDRPAGPGHRGPAGCSARRLARPWPTVATGDRPAARAPPISGCRRCSPTSPTPARCARAVED